MTSGNLDLATRNFARIALRFASPGEDRAMPELSLRRHLRAGANETYLDLIVECGSGANHVEGKSTSKVVCSGKAVAALDTIELWVAFGIWSRFPSRSLFYRRGRDLNCCWRVDRPCRGRGSRAAVP